MISPRVLAAIYVASSAGAVFWLWQWWTPQCNEACASWLVISMYGTFLAILVAAVVVAAMTLWGKLSRKASVVIFTLGAIILLLWVGFVSHNATVQDKQSDCERFDGQLA